MYEKFCSYERLVNPVPGPGARVNRTYRYQSLIGRVIDGRLSVKQPEQARCRLPGLEVIRSQRAYLAQESSSDHDAVHDPV